MQVATATRPSNAPVVRLTFWLRAQDRHAFDSRLLVVERVTFPLPFQRTRAMNRHAQSKRRKGDKTNMSTEETNTDATVAERGAHVAPEKTSPRKGATRKKGAPKGRKTAKRAKAASPKKAAKAGKKTAAKKASA